MWAAYKLGQSKNISEINVNANGVWVPRYKDRFKTETRPNKPTIKQGMWPQPGDKQSPAQNQATETNINNPDINNTNIDGPKQK